MPSPALERLESLLQTRKLAHTVGRLPADRLVASTGIPALDATWQGGWPAGELSELTGARSSGRTSVLVATLAAAVRQGGIAALVDAFDRFDPPSAARAGVDLDRVLWVRGPALSSIGAPRRPSLPDRAVLNAIRACDLIVRAGGFAVVALDLIDAPPRALRALPFTTWLRLAHANEGRETACLLLADAPLARSARGRSLHLATRPRWIGASAQQRQCAGFNVKDVERS